LHRLATAVSSKQGTVGEREIRNAEKNFSEKDSGVADQPRDFHEQVVATQGRGGDATGGFGLARSSKPFFDATYYR
jgi:hypothetical protein